MRQWTPYTWPDLSVSMTDDILDLLRRQLFNPQELAMQTFPELLLPNIQGTDQDPWLLDGGEFDDVWPGDMPPLDAGGFTGGLRGRPFAGAAPTDFPAPASWRVIGPAVAITPRRSGQVDVQLSDFQGAGERGGIYRNVSWPSGLTISVGENGHLYQVKSNYLFVPSGASLEDLGGWDESADQIPVQSGGTITWVDAYKVKVSAEDLTPHYLYTDDDVNASKLAEGDVVDLEETGADDAYKWVTINHAVPSAGGGETEMGDGTEGSEAAEVATWAADGVTGLKLYFAKRVGYFHAGDETLWQYLPLMTIDPWGHIVGVGAENRIEVDKTEVCT